MMPKSAGARAKSPPPGRAKKTTPQRATSPNASTRRVKDTAPSNGTPRRPSASLDTKSHPCAKKTPAKPTHHKAPKTTPHKRPEGPEKRGSQAAATDSPSPSGSVKKGGVRCKKISSSGNKVLLGVLESLKIRKQARSEATDKVNDVVDCILKHVKTSSKYFQDIAKLPTGSYYENVKISEPDEFDIMLTVPVHRVQLEQFDSNGAFYSVSFKRNPKTPLVDFVLKDGTLSAHNMLVEFRKHVIEATTLMKDVQVERKKKGCPAVTLQVKEISVDIVLGLEVHSMSWPAMTKDGFNIVDWLGTKVKKDFKLKPFYLVPKYVGKGWDEKEGVHARDAWRISFSHIEKGILKNHGFAKTCCESGGSKCCRKQCLKLLKHLLNELKQKHPKELSKFFSYQAKTVLLHGCVKRPNDSQWELANLDDCFQQLLDDFIRHLETGSLPHFFVPTYNLLESCSDSKKQEFLIDCINSERNNMFPIFK
ncbi:cyclic GMP-AMP synthase [Acipenser ruthenus]|uniref:cyclic GMP-AMP synthase n=1 Tax=Acipenser ruthenus TaxID=7906 RepID=UPI00274094AF|nr:cyclic GMP-AMP synthase [Acipenser ruthenus]